MHAPSKRVCIVAQLECKFHLASVHHTVLQPHHNAFKRVTSDFKSKISIAKTMHCNCFFISNQPYIYQKRFRIISDFDLI